MTDVVLLDGGMGQELLHRSAQKPHPMWSAKVMLDEPEIVEAVHRDFIDAGARIITLNNYTATPERLKREGRPDLFEPLQHKAIEIARRARDQSKLGHKNKVRIAGCLPPLYASYKPELAPSFEECLKRYQVIADIQAPSVDLFICETMSSIKEGKAAAIAGIKTGRPTWLGFTLEDSLNVCLRSKEPLIDAINEVMDIGVEAILLNCSLPEAISAAMETLSSRFNTVGVYANGFASIDALQPGGTVENLIVRNDLGPENYADFALSWVKSGAKIVGGCCEVGPSHIAQLEKQLIAKGYSLQSHL
ncbi:MAG: homocysteine S-methyltransferase family protein [Sneathiella sp.]